VIVRTQSGTELAWTVVIRSVVQSTVLFVPVIAMSVSNGSWFPIRSLVPFSPIVAV